MVFLNLFLDFLGFFSDFLDFFLDFLDLLDVFWILGFFEIFWFFLDFFFVIVTYVTTKCYHGYYWTQKMGQNSIKSFFFCPKGKKRLGRSPPQELEVGPRSGPYLLVLMKDRSMVKSACTISSRLGHWETVPWSSANFFDFFLHFDTVYY